MSTALHSIQHSRPRLEPESRVDRFEFGPMMPIIHEFHLPL
jgi:hypothetical protein